MGRQFAAGKRDDDGVVAGQQHINPYDLKNGEPEAGFVNDHGAPRFPHQSYWPVP
jgi:hypothetical protein